MSTVSPQLVLGLCIIGACVATVIGYAISHLLRKKSLNEHEESDEMTNPFHDMNREQKDYMVEVRRRTTDALWESLRIELKRERERQSAMMAIGGSGGGSGVVSEQRLWLVCLGGCSYENLADCCRCSHRSDRDTIIRVACTIRCNLLTQAQAQALDLALALGMETVMRTLLVTMKMWTRPLRYGCPWLS
jgi:hypothetical protein